MILALIFMLKQVKQSVGGTEKKKHSLQTLIRKQFFNTATEKVTVDREEIPCRPLIRSFLQ